MRPCASNISESMNIISMPRWSVQFGATPGAAGRQSGDRPGAEPESGSQEVPLVCKMQGDGAPRDLLPKAQGSVVVRH